MTSDKWGPFKGRLLHLSYGTCSLFLVLKEEVNGQVQGGVVRFPLYVRIRHHARPLQPRRRPTLRRRPEGLADERRRRTAAFSASATPANRCECRRV